MTTTQAALVHSRRKRPTLVQLRAFVAVCDAGGFVEGATRLGLSQPTVSQAIADLETAIDAQLIERGGRHIIITPTGRALLPYARDTVAAGDAFANAAQHTGPRSAPVTMGIIPTIAPYLLPSALPAAERAGIHLGLVEHTTADLMRGLTTGAIDVAVAAMPLQGPGIATIPLYRERFVLMLPSDHPWAGRDDIDTAQISADQLVLLEEGHCLRDQTLALCGADREANSPAARRPLVTTSTLATMVEIVSAGYGITVLPETALARCRRVTDLAVARFRSPAPYRDVALVYRCSSAQAEQYRLLADAVQAGARRARLPVELASM